MNERPTKKQKELLDFINAFISEYGYSPSYREIKAGLSYGSVATVAKHIDNLVARGLIAKRRRSARSLEPTTTNISAPQQLRPKTSGGEKWLVDAVDARFRMAEATRMSQNTIDQLTVLVASLKVLGLDGAFTAFQSRLSQIIAGQKSRSR